MDVGKIMNMSLRDLLLGVVGCAGGIILLYAILAVIVLNGSIYLWLFVGVLGVVLLSLAIIIRINPHLTYSIEIRVIKKCLEREQQRRLEINEKCEQRRHVRYEYDDYEGNGSGVFSGASWSTDKCGHIYPTYDGGCKECSKSHDNFVSHDTTNPSDGQINRKKRPRNSVECKKELD